MPAPKKATKHPVTRPLRCGICAASGPQLSIPGAGNRRTVHGKGRRSQWVRCTECGREWYSVHPEALARGKAADQAAIAAGAGLDDDRGNNDAEADGA